MGVCRLAHLRLGLVVEHRRNGRFLELSSGGSRSPRSSRCRDHRRAPILKRLGDRGTSYRTMIEIIEIGTAQARTARLTITAVDWPSECWSGGSGCSARSGVARSARPRPCRRDHQTGPWERSPLPRWRYRPTSCREPRRAHWQRGGQGKRRVRWKGDIPSPRSGGPPSADFVL